MIEERGLALGSLTLSGRVAQVVTTLATASAIVGVRLVGLLNIEARTAASPTDDRHAKTIHVSAVFLGRGEVDVGRAER